MADTPAESTFRAVVTREDGREFDITEGLRVMYDAIIGSMDWGSGFLDSEEAAAISRVGEMCGFELKDYDEDLCAVCSHPFEKHDKWATSKPSLCYDGITGYYHNPAARVCPCTGYTRRSLL